ncbi:hypothetical protein CRENBAI_021636 [Crenichthys baileyi]|uniref:Uncharacterized protein n=1 Tax=Crenichthys baileyi TaxID=28760 RepID=A0AAV9RWY3_9TELE
MLTNGVWRSESQLCHWCELLPHNMFGNRAPVTLQSVREGEDDAGCSSKRQKEANSMCAHHLLREKSISARRQAKMPATHSAQKCFFNINQMSWPWYQLFQMWFSLEGNSGKSLFKALNRVRSGSKDRQQKDTLILRRGEKEGKTAVEEGTASQQSSLSDVLPFPAVWFYDGKCVPLQ